MAHVFWLRERQLESVQTFFPKSRGVRRVDDGKVLSGMIPRAPARSALGGCSAR